ncbi:hypothetical protein Pelo_18873 [Pelomyxa schiedti]|nr:hypothetical protein Pelo_18873 [Pelomyxa schiedti]
MKSCNDTKRSLFDISSNNVANGKQGSSNNIANGKQVSSNNIVNGKQVSSNNIANGKQVSSNNIANGKQVSFFVLLECVRLIWTRKQLEIEVNNQVDLHNLDFLRYEAWFSGKSLTGLASAYHLDSKVVLPMSAECVCSSAPFHWSFYAFMLYAHGSVGIGASANTHLQSQIFSFPTFV